MLTLSACGSSAFAQESRRFTVEELLKVRRVGDPQVSPDGKRVAFTIGDVNWDANKVVTQIYVMTVDGGGMKQLTSGASSAQVRRPQAIPPAENCGERQRQHRSGRDRQADVMQHRRLFQESPHFRSVTAQRICEHPSAWLLASLRLSCGRRYQ